MISSRSPSNVGGRRALAATVAGGVMLALGVAHLARPGVFIALMPASWPARAGANALAGLAEGAIGAGLLAGGRYRRPAALAGTALMVAFVPVHMAHLTAGAPQAVAPLPQGVLWARLALQPALIAGFLWLAGGRPHLRRQDLPTSPMNPVRPGGVV